MSKEQSIEELQATYANIKSKFAEINQNAIRDKRSDYALLSQDELSEVLKSKISRRQKTKVLNTQIGYLRINMFHEYYEQIIRLQQKREFSEAVELMNNYAESIAIPFVKTKKQLAILKGIRNLFRIRESINPSVTIDTWRAYHQAWLRENGARNLERDQECNGEFQKLFTAFLTLYTYSFSVNNFPPLGQRRTDR